MILQIIATFFGTLSFAILFNIPKKQLFLCGLNGAIGWAIYILTLKYINSPILATFISTIILTLIARILANIRKNPITIFLVSGIIPLVPGAGIYNTMYNIITNQNVTALYYGIETLKIAGVIAIAIIMVLSLPQKYFKLKKPL